MQVTRYRHAARTGWDRPFDASLDGERTLVLVFGPPDLPDDAQPFRDVIDAFPASRIAGCSTTGAIDGDRIHDGCVVVAVVRFDATTIRLATAPVASGDRSEEAGTALGRALAADAGVGSRDGAAGPLRGILVLSDGLDVNGSALVRGITAAVPDGIPVLGGLAGDNARFTRTWVVADRTLRGGWVTAIGLYGEQVLVGHGSQGGWAPFGVERLITRSRGNVLYELDGRPALELYREYLGDLAAGLPTTALLFPLTVFEESDARRLVRTVLAIDERDQSMTFAGDIPEGGYAQLMTASADGLVQGASDAALEARGALPPADDSPAGEATTLALAVACAGRRLVLGERTEEELEATLDALPAHTVQVGFYSHGELAPFRAGLFSDLHNQTMTMITVTEV